MHLAVGQAEFPGSSRFCVEARLGEGGMGVVYRVYDRQLQQRVALKTLRVFDPENLLRLKREFRGLRGLRHPNLVALDELHEDNGWWFITMELLQGEHFVQHLRGVDPWLPTTAPLSRERSTTLPSDRRPIEAMAPERSPMPRSHDPLLRNALVQLAQGLWTLHEAGKIHCDVKPSNVLVTDDGRVVLLDFGLLAESLRQRPSVAGRIVGTAAYMAPEQGYGLPIGPAADCYAVGVMLYEVLTGRLPFDGDPMAVLMRKQVEDPPDPLEVASDIPSDLATLCRDLLAIDSTKRPSAEAILERLGAAPLRVAYLPARPAPSKPFVGRGHELQILRQALARAEAGHIACVRVTGESGVGKTALLDTFCRTVASEREDVVVLQGRCYPRETVPFGGFDEVFDELAELLCTQPVDEAYGWLPAHADLLTRLFPTLLRVPLLERPETAASTMDAFELRLAAFEALRVLLTRLGRARLVILSLDDLQWANDDSIRVIEELMRPPAAPVLLLLGDRGHAAAAERVKALPGVETLPLEPLRGAAAEQLAKTLLGTSGDDTAAAERLVRATGGNPLYMQVLAQRVEAGLEIPDLDVDAAVRAQVEDLPSAARHVLTLLAVSGRPVERSVLRKASGLQPAPFQRELERLESDLLLEQHGTLEHHRLRLYHARVGEAVVAGLTRADRTELHASWVAALQDDGSADPELLANHLEGAGWIDDARHYVIEAARAAAEALAFDRSVELYRRGLKNVPFESSDRELWVAFARALVGAGRPREAAEVYHRAASGAEPQLARELQLHAVEQWILSGHFEQGIRAMQQLLGELGMRGPTTRLGQLLSIVREQRAGGARQLTSADPMSAPAERPPIEFPRSIVVAQRCAAALSLFDPLGAAELQARCTNLAVRAGDWRCRAQALLSEVYTAALPGPQATGTVDRLLVELERAVEQPSDPEFGLTVSFARGLTAYHMMRFGEARAHLKEAENLAFAEHVGTWYQLDTVRIYLALIAVSRGDIDEGYGLLPVTAQVRDKGDLYAYTLLSLTMVPVELWLDRIGPAQARIDDCLRVWMRRDGLDMQRISAAAGQALVDLHGGRPELALSRLVRFWPSLAVSLYMRVQTLRVLMLGIFGRVAVARVAAGRSTMARVIARWVIGKLRREDVGLARAEAARLVAGLHNIKGEPQAVEALEHARVEFERLDARLDALAVARASARLRGDAAAFEAADVALREAGIANPARLGRWLVPGCGDPPTD